MTLTPVLSRGSLRSIMPITYFGCPTVAALAVCAAGGEQPQLVQMTPGRVLAQVQLVGLPGQAAVPGKESG
jgi:hypothetical protein